LPLHRRTLWAEWGRIQKATGIPLPLLGKACQKPNGVSAVAASSPKANHSESHFSNFLLSACCESLSNSAALV
jgi:hypothetical protein